MFSQGLQAQPWFVQGNIEHPGPGHIRLASYYGDRFMVIDSLEAGSGSFHFVLDKDHAPGIYRLIFSALDQGILTENSFVEFIFNQEDVHLNISMEDLGPVVQSEDSEENNIYQDFVRFQMSYELRIRQAYEALAPRDPGNPVWEASADYYEALQQGRLEYMDSLTALHPGLYATRIMNAFRVPLVSGRISHRQRIDTLKQLFFLEAPLDDPGLLHAPVYTFRIVDYLSLYSDPSLGRTEQEEAFIAAVDHLMANAAAEEELQSFLVSFLLDGFELLGMEAVQLHLMDAHVDEHCSADLAELVAERMDAYRRMAVGSRAPVFVLRDVEGRTHRLDTTGQGRTLILFWSTTCGHCREMIPELYRWYEEEQPPGLQVLSISIDSSSSAHMDFLESQALPQWINVHENGGWQGKTAGDYHVYETPSMFLLDGKGIIVEKPRSLKQLIRALR